MALRQVAGIVCLAGCMAAANVSATLIDQGATTLDDATNLEWLDLTATLGLSINQVEASTLFTVDGYRHATTTEVNQLFLNAGFVSTNNTNSTANDAAAALLLELMGCTQFCNTNSDTGRGFAYNSGSWYSRPNYHEGALGGGAAVISLQTANKDLIDATSGHFLVRISTASSNATSVPEPATVGLLGAGLLALGLMRRKRAA